MEGSTFIIMERTGAEQGICLAPLFWYNREKICYEEKWL